MHEEICKVVFSKEGLGVGLICGVGFSDEGFGVGLICEVGFGDEEWGGGFLWLARFGLSNEQWVSEWVIGGSWLGFWMGPWWRVAGFLSRSMAAPCWLSEFLNFINFFQFSCISWSLASLTQMIWDMLILFQLRKLVVLGYVEDFASV